MGPQSRRKLKEGSRNQGIGLSDPDFGMGVGGGGANGNKSEVCEPANDGGVLRCEGESIGEVPRGGIPQELQLFSMRQTKVTALR